MNNNKIITCAVIALSLLSIILSVTYYLKHINDSSTKSKALNEYRVYCDERFFQSDNRDFLYAPGTTVRLLFPLPADNIKYSFNVIGVDSFDAHLDDQKGYYIQFEMPNNHVSVYYKVEEPFNGIGISLAENPSTGFQWSYELSAKDILSPVEDRFESDSQGNADPVTGNGGVHYWKFKINRSGIITITFNLLRGDEQLDTVTYKYKCDSSNGTFEVLD